MNKDEEYYNMRDNNREKRQFLQMAVCAQLAVIFIVSILVGCIDNRDMSRREAVDIMNLSKELGK